MFGNFETMKAEMMYVVRRSGGKVTCGRVIGRGFPVPMTLRLVRREEVMELGTTEERIDCEAAAARLLVQNVDLFIATTRL